MPVSSFSRRSEKASNLALDIAVDVFAFARQFKQRVEVGSQSRNCSLASIAFLQPLALLHDLLALLGLVPEIGIGDLFFEFG